MHSTSHGKTQRVRRAAKDWETVMAQYAASGLSQEAFCAREQIALGTFGSWRARLRAQPLAMQKANQKTKKVAAVGLPFLELVASASARPPFAQEELREFDIELDLGRGIVLRMRNR